MLTFCAVLAALVLHEWAHVWVAVRCGDNTSRHRLTLNPMAHLDWCWSLLVPLAVWLLSRGYLILGAGKPVYVAYASLTRPQQFAVASAGIAMNALLGIGAWLLGWESFAVANAGLAVTNLLPLPGLDGWWMARILGAHPAQRYRV